jgi:hypothetical protein
LAGHVGDQRGADLGAVDLGQVRLDVAGGHAAGIQRQDHVIDLAEPPLPFRHDLRLEGAITVAGNPDPDRPGRRGHRFVITAVAGIARAVPRRVAFHIPQVVIELGAQRPLQHRLGQLAQ